MRVEPHSWQMILRSRYAIRQLIIRVRLFMHIEVSITFYCRDLRMVRVREVVIARTLQRKDLRVII